MNEEIKEILDDMKSIPSDEICGLGLGEKQCKLLLNYITNLQKENTNLKKLCDKYEEEHKTTFEKWKKVIARNEKAIENIDLVIELIKQQPTEDDSWILNRLNGFKYLLQGGDE